MPQAACSRCACAEAYRYSARREHSKNRSCPSSPSRTSSEPRNSPSALLDSLGLAGTEDIETLRVPTKVVRESLTQLKGHGDLLFGAGGTKLSRDYGRRIQYRGVRAD